MKMMLKLAVLLATLLLITGVSFADGCYWYEITWQFINFPEDPDFKYACIQLCFDYDNTGKIDGVCEFTDIALFFNSMRDQALAYGGGGVLHLKFHGDDQFVVTAIGQCPPNPRFKLWGHKVIECPY
jgi:hypothetical protein